MGGRRRPDEVVGLSDMFAWVGRRGETDVVVVVEATGEDGDGDEDEEEQARVYDGRETTRVAGRISRPANHSTRHHHSHSVPETIFIYFFPFLFAVPFLQSPLNVIRPPPFALPVACPASTCTLSFTLPALTIERRGRFLELSVKS